MTIESRMTENFRERGESYKEGMLVLIEHLMDKDWKTGDKLTAKVNSIKKEIERTYEEYINHLDEAGSFKEHKKQFDIFLKSYNDTLLLHTTLKNPFKALLLAERCSVWKKGREYLETVAMHEFVQSEVALENGNALLKQEYSKINSATPPLWFLNLALWQQSFIKANWEELYACSVPSSLRCVPGLANTLLHAISVNNGQPLTYFRHATQFPVDLLEQKSSVDEGFRLTCLNLALQISLSLEKQFDKSDHDKIPEAVILTQSLLSPGFLANVKSTLLSGPTDNDTTLYNMKEKAVELFQKALNHPLKHKDFLKNWGLIVQNNGTIEYKGHFFGKITLLSTNNPLNILRRFGAYKDQIKHNNVNTALLLGAVGRYLLPLYEKMTNKQHDIIKPLNSLLEKLYACETNLTISNADKKYLIKTLNILSEEKIDKNTHRLFDALISLLSIPKGQGSFEINDSRHRKSLVNTMENIIINCIGGTVWTACKSGKDRTGGVSAACDAASIFYEIHGKFPRYQDTDIDRKLYLSMYETLFNSGHHQKVASQNAIGAEGLVLPTTFLPGDININAEQVKVETQISRLNKPRLSAQNSSFFPEVKKEESLVIKSYKSNPLNHFM